MSEKHWCAAEVFVFDGWCCRPCQQPGKYFEDRKWWCGTHAPSKAKAIRKKRAEKLAATLKAEAEAEAQAENREAMRDHWEQSGPELLAACKAALSARPLTDDPRIGLWRRLAEAIENGTP